MAKVFLSHSSKDRATADAVIAHLRARHQLFLDHDAHAGIAAGAEWERTLYEQLSRADAVLCLVTHAYVESRWCFAEVAIAKAQGRLVIPLNAEAGVSHPLLGDRQQVDYANVASDALARVAATLAALDAAGGPAYDDSRPAFPGLAAFEAADRAVFFGRDAEIASLARDVRARTVQRQSRATILVGASGSGKSSLIRAGLLPRLCEEPSDWWRVLPFTPGTAPMSAIAEALARALKEVGLAANLDAIRRQLPGGLQALVPQILVAAPGDRRNLLLVVDQLEELFTRTDAASRSMFLSLLVSASTDRDSTVSVVATLRSEFLGELLRTEEAKRLTSHVVTLAPLAHEHLAEIVSEPARKAGFEFDSALVTRLVDDTGSGEALPLLAFTLSRMTEGLARGSRLDLARYAAVGGVAAALQNGAHTALEEAMETAGVSEDAAVRSLLAFVTLDDTGRRNRRSRLRAQLDPSTISIVDAFVHARLLTTDDSAAGPMVTVTHEALFREWPRLREAIDGAESDLRFRRSLEQAAAEWERAHEDHKASLYWRLERLARARSLVLREPAIGARERAFVRASLADEHAAAEREAEILVDRVLVSNLIESDTELALLYLLAAADEYAATNSVIAAMQRVLRKHRLVQRVGPFETQLLAAAISDDGRIVAAVNRGTNQRPSTRGAPPEDLRVSLWPLGTLSPMATTLLAGHDARALTWSRDAHSVALVVDGRILVLDGTTLATGRSIELTGETRGAHFELEFLDDGSLDVAAVMPNERLIWKVPAEIAALASPPTREPASHSTTTKATDGRQFDCRHAQRVLRLENNAIAIEGYGAVDAPERCPVSKFDDVVWTVRLGSDVLSIAPGNRLRCLESSTRLVAPNHPPRPLPWSNVVAAAFSRDGNRLALASRMALAVLNVETTQILLEFGRHEDEDGDVYSSLAFDESGRWIASGSVARRRSHLWDAETGKRVRALDGYAVGLSPDGRVSAAATRTRIAIEVDGERLANIEDAAARTFAFAPDGNGILGLTEDGSRFVDAYTSADPGYKAPLAAREYSLPGGNLAAEYDDGPEAFGFTRDSKHVLGLTHDGVLRWPDRTPAAVIARARAVVFRSLTDEERMRFELRRV